MNNDKAQELTSKITESINALCAETDAAKQSATYRAWLSTLSRFHNYSFLCGSEHRKDYVQLWTMLMRDAPIHRKARVYCWCTLWRSPKKQPCHIIFDGRNPSIVMRFLAGASAGRRSSRPPEGPSRGGIIHPSCVGERISQNTWQRILDCYSQPVTARLQRGPSIAAATSSVNSSALCNAPFILIISSSREVIWPAGSLCSFAAFRLRW
jgi:hypothetical protein